MIDHDKWEELKGLVMLMRVLPGIDAERSAEVIAKATALARELFPPSAKPLEWSLVGDVWVSQKFLRQWYRIREFTSTPGDMRFNCSICNDHNTESIQWFASLDEAKAFCESHHQSRFKELLV